MNQTATPSVSFQPGSIVSARGREWVVLPQSEGDLLHLRPIGSGEDIRTIIYAPLERQPVTQATFPSPTPEQAGIQAAGLLLRDALMLKLATGPVLSGHLGILLLSQGHISLFP